MMLGQREVAAEILERCLARTPENAIAYTNRGWIFLQHRRTTDALNHFREALRLDPEMTVAKKGLIESIYSQNPVYRLTEKYFLWIRKYIGKSKGWSIICLYCLYRLSEVISWTLSPFFYLSFRFHPFGKGAFTPEQNLTVKWTVSCLFGAVLAVSYWGFSDNFNALYLAFACWLLTLPITAISKHEEGWIRWKLAMYTIALACLSLLSVSISFLNTQSIRLEKLSTYSWALFVLGIMLSGFAGDFLKFLNAIRLRSKK
jgi:hypothetical protein